MTTKEQKNTVLIVSIITSFLTAFLGSSVNVALPSIQKEFNIDAVTLVWISSAYLLATATILVPFGRFSDIIGRKKTFFWGLIVFLTFSFLCAFSPNIQILIALRVFQGIGASMIFSTSTAILTSVFPQGERGRAMGLSVSAVYLGLTLGPVLGGVLTSNLGWRSIFWLNLPIGIFIIYLVNKKLGGLEWADSEGEKFDLLGTILYISGLLLLMLGFTRIQTPLGKTLAIVSIIILFVFIYTESKIDYPIIPMSLFFKNITFSLSNLAALINYSATFAIGFLLSLYLQYIKGLTAQNTGFILAIQPVVQAIFSSYAGKLSDRIEPRFVASFGMFLTAVGIFMLSLINSTTPFYFIYSAQILLGLGFAFFSSPNTNAIMSSVDKKFYGVASASVGTMRLVGQTLSIGIVTMLFAIHLGGTKFTPDLFPKFMSLTHSIWLGFSIVCAFGIFASIARGNIR
ncbi:MFS transporter [Bacteroidetes/Chlorobi group bacterium Naka2016]|jgi:EmrB/QacA subfamily drug resistance transporter|nr:MAG: MFS transporter [Bacteroidetes/Chlorobi group bacterium Naka2016]